MKIRSRAVRRWIKDSVGHTDQAEADRAGDGLFPGQGVQLLAGIGKMQRNRGRRDVQRPGDAGVIEPACQALKTLGLTL